MKKLLVLTSTVLLGIGIVECEGKEEDKGGETPQVVEETKYTVFFDANGGTGTMASGSVKAGEEYTIPENKFVKEGFALTMGGERAYINGESYIMLPQKGNRLDLYCSYGERIVGYINDAFTINGRGTVITTQTYRTVKQTSSLQYVHIATGEVKDLEIKGLEVSHKVVETALPFSMLGINVNLEKDQFATGDYIIEKDGGYTLSNSFEGEFAMRSEDEGGIHTPIRNEEELEFSIGGCTFRFNVGIENEDKMIFPGATENVTFTHKTGKFAFYVGQIIPVRKQGRTIGTFKVTSLGGQE